jgi:LPXTG-motif cell wall-anchored protein
LSQTNAKEGKQFERNRRDNMRKKVIFALFMVIALTITSTFTAFAATDISSELAGYDFADGTPSGMELVGGSLTDDSERGQVLTLTGGKTGTSYASVDFSLFKDNDFSKGMTIAMWLKADKGIPGSAPLYAFDIAGTGYIATVATLEPAINTTANTDTGYKLVWVDPANVNDSPEQAIPADGWHHLAVTVSENGMKIYLDGRLFSEPVLGFSSANYAEFMTQLKHITGLKLGSWDCTWWQYGDYAGAIDDVYLFNSELTKDEVVSVMNGPAEEAVEDGSAAATTEEVANVPKTGEVSYAMFFLLGTVIFGAGAVVLKRKERKIKTV